MLVLGGRAARTDAGDAREQAATAPTLSLSAPHPSVHAHTPRSRPGLKDLAHLVMGGPRAPAGVRQAAVGRRVEGTKMKRESIPDFLMHLASLSRRREPPAPPRSPLPRPTHTPLGRAA